MIVSKAYPNWLTVDSIIRNCIHRRIQ